MIRHARLGKKRQARLLAGELARRLRTGEPIPDAARDYLAQALEDIASGAKADTALNTGGKRGIRESNPLAPASIGATIAELRMREGHATSKNQAFIIAERELNYAVDADTIRKAHAREYGIK